MKIFTTEIYSKFVDKDFSRAGRIKCDWRDATILGEVEILSVKFIL